MASGFGLFWCSSSTGWYTSNHISQKRGFAQGSNRIGSVRRLLCGFFRFAKKLCKAVMFGMPNPKEWIPKWDKQDNMTPPVGCPSIPSNFVGELFPKEFLSSSWFETTKGIFSSCMIAESLRYQSFCFGIPVDLGQWFPPNLEKQKYLMKNTSGSGATWTLDLVVHLLFEIL